MTSAAAVKIDAMRRQDWKHVRAIYAEGLAAGIASFLWKPPLWRDWDAGHLTLGRFVARDKIDAVLAWAALAPVPDT